MPKFAIVLISSALAGITGFLLGALFTVPQNKEMEELMQFKTEMAQQVQTLGAEKENLAKSNEALKKEITSLKDKLLKSYEVDKETSLF